MHSYIEGNVDILLTNIEKRSAGGKAPKLRNMPDAIGVIGPDSHVKFYRSTMSGVLRIHSIILSSLHSLGKTYSCGRIWTRHVAGRFVEYRGAIMLLCWW